MNEASRVFRLVVASICAYEAAAITTRKTPTVSRICWERRWLTPVILGGLAVHLLKGPTHGAVRR